jgi:hypothetical protein
MGGTREDIFAIFPFSDKIAGYCYFRGSGKEQRWMSKQK